MRAARAEKKLLPTPPPATRFAFSRKRVYFF